MSNYVTYIIQYAEGNASQYHFMNILLVDGRKYKTPGMHRRL